MTALIIIGCIVLLFLLIGFFPVRIRISYVDSLKVYIPILFFRIRLFPKKRKLKSMSKKKFDKLRSGKKKKPEKKKKKREESKEKPKEEKKKRLSFSEIRELVGDVRVIAGKIISKLRSYLKVKIYSLVIVISSDDASKTAITYGAVSGATANLMALLEDNCRISYSRGSSAGVYCDYLTGSCSAEIDIRFSIFVWQILALGLKALFGFIKIKNKTEVNKNAGNKDK